MQVLAINGSPLKDRGNTNIILTEFLTGLEEAGAEVEQIFISDLNINPCLGKLICWSKTPGICCQNDDMKGLLDRMKQAEVWVFASPIYWDSVVGPMKNLFDRLLPLITPDIILIDGHCRHALRDGVKNGKIVLVSSCGFWEMDNFEPLLKHIMALSKNIHREFAGALLRPHGALLKYMIRNFESVKDILTAARQAGHELVIDGEISQVNMIKVSLELMSREEYIDLVNENFKQIILHVTKSKK